MKRTVSLILMLCALGYCAEVKAQDVCAPAKKAAQAYCASLVIPAQIAACAAGMEVAFSTPVHMPFFDLFTMDLGGSISRGIQVVLKFFLSDDNTLVAELVYDGDSGSGGSSGGCGGAYTGDSGSASLGGALKAVSSPLTDIPAEAAAYPEGVKVQDTSIAELAKYRIQSAVQEQAGLDQLSADKWAIQYRAQQRAIQAMTDALVMKKAYKDLAAVAVSGGSYGNYSEAASTVATRRLLLDALMALRKRVVAARVRARAETMEMDIEGMTTAPSVEGSDSGSSNNNPSNGSPQNTTGNNNVPTDVDDLGTGSNNNSNNGN